MLMLCETRDLASYPKGQIVAIYDQSLRDYLSSACVKGEDGVTPEWRILDKDTDVSGDGKAWQEAMKRPHPTMPWIVVSNGKTGYEGPLPADSAAIKALVQKYEVKP